MVHVHIGCKHSLLIHLLAPQQLNSTHPYPQTQNLTVTSRRAKRPLLNDVTGAITDGFYAIMVREEWASGLIRLG